MSDRWKQGQVRLVRWRLGPCEASAAPPENPHRKPSSPAIGSIQTQQIECRRSSCGVRSMAKGTTKSQIVAVPVTWKTATAELGHFGGRTERERGSTIARFPDENKTRNEAVVGGTEGWKGGAGRVGKMVQARQQLRSLESREQTEEPHGFPIVARTKQSSLKIGKTNGMANRRLL